MPEPSFQEEMQALLYQEKGASQIKLLGYNNSIITEKYNNFKNNLLKFSYIFLNNEIIIQETNYMKSRNEPER
ncbi:MAG: hypothetical protein VB070_04725, partial [Clostridiaceae bacterium]|nr:hypothetical protein [Clostridiaceae bacterium]